jgi:hypothetical protein
MRKRAGKNGVVFLEKPILEHIKGETNSKVAELYGLMLELILNMCIGLKLDSVCAEG